MFGVDQLANPATQDRDPEPLTDSFHPNDVAAAAAAEETTENK